LYCDPHGQDIRFTDAGKYLMMIADPTSLTSGSFGRVYLQYDIELYLPQLEDAVVSSGGYYELQTASGTTLTDWLGDGDVQWNTIGLVRTGRTLVIPCSVGQRFQFEWYVVGGTLASLSVSYAGCVANSANVVNEAGTNVSFSGLITATSDTELTLVFSGTAASITTSGTPGFLAIAPQNPAITLHETLQQKVQRLENTLQEVGDIEDIVKKLSALGWMKDSFPPARNVGKKTKTEIKEAETDSEPEDEDDLESVRSGSGFGSRAVRIMHPDILVRQPKK
jgi:hypothetical protein